jgi:3-carboxy-cis,cis-muconate cycloisomerase
MLKKAQPIVVGDLTRLEKALLRLSNQHKDTVMLGRTLLQGAPPITFGLKAAGWLGAIRRSRVRLESAFAESLVLQFGGASGTLAALGSQGVEVERRMAEKLGLGFPDAPWHANRDRLASVVVACGVVTGCLGKMARDISLLMQEEVGEASEAASDGRGGSSTMPQKRNPIACALTLASANRVPGLAAAFLASMVQEHERAVGGWQSEASTVAAVIQATGLAAASMAEAAEGLEVNKTRMRENIAATRGTVFAERAVMLLGSKLGRAEAHKLVAEAARKSNAEKRRFVEVLGEMPEVARLIDVETLRRLDTPEEYLGAAEEFRRRLVSGSERHDSGKKKE